MKSCLTYIFTKRTRLQFGKRKLFKEVRTLGENNIHFHQTMNKQIAMEYVEETLNKTAEMESQDHVELKNC